MTFKESMEDSWTDIKTFAVMNPKSAAVMSAVLVVLGAMAGCVF